MDPDEIDDTGLDPELELEDDFDGQEDDPEGDLDEGHEGEDPEDHGEEDPSGADEGEGQRPDQVGRGRADRRIQALSKQLRDLKAQLATSPQGRGNGQGDASPEARRLAQEREQAYLATLSTEERIEYRLAQSEQRHEAALAQVRFESADKADKLTFDDMCRRNPAAAKLKDRVEQMLAAERGRGVNYPRETILKFVIGEQALKNAPRAQGKAQRQAQDQRQRQQARPGQGRSDVNQSNNRHGSEREQRRARLEDQLI